MNKYQLKNRDETKATRNRVFNAYTLSGQYQVSEHLLGDYQDETRNSS